MIFVFILLLQLVQYNVQGQHYLVETEDEQDEQDERSMNRMNRWGKYGPDQVYEYFLPLCIDQAHTDKSL